MFSSSAVMRLLGDEGNKRVACGKHDGNMNSLFHVFIYFCLNYIYWILNFPIKVFGQ